MAKPQCVLSGLRALYFLVFLLITLQFLFSHSYMGSCNFFSFILSLVSNNNIFQTTPHPSFPCSSHLSLSMGHVLETCFIICLSTCKYPFIFYKVKSCDAKSSLNHLLYLNSHLKVLIFASEKFHIYLMYCNFSFRSVESM